MVAYDDSDGWVRPRHLEGPGRCRPTTAVGHLPRRKVDVDQVDHTAVDQASITRFTENDRHPGRVGDACPPYVQDLKAQNTAATNSTSPALPIALATGLLTTGAVTTAFALRRRRTRARSPGDSRVDA
ncbi:hypothetical protein [Streptomyces sp. ADMS]|uniref:hypothetical protein n=1 Tax=Streptomyces sp. ADMS TaxID=3071415 RepID=UPI0039948B22